MFSLYKNPALGGSLYDYPINRTAAVQEFDCRAFVFVASLDSAI